jgi:hypothetical protein
MREKRCVCVCTLKHKGTAVSFFIFRTRSLLLFRCCARLAAQGRSQPRRGPLRNAQPLFMRAAWISHSVQCPKNAQQPPLPLQRPHLPSSARAPLTSPRPCNLRACCPTSAPTFSYGCHRTSLRLTCRAVLLAPSVSLHICCRRVPASWQAAPSSTPCLRSLAAGM